MHARKGLVVASCLYGLAASFAFTALLVGGCSSSGTSAAQTEAGTDATATDGTVSEDASVDASDGDDGGDGDAAFVPCYPVVAAQPLPSDNCVFAGPCPEDCLTGTASAYACSVPGGNLADAAPAYPSVITAPIGVINVVATSSDQYPWEAGAYVACGPLACVRWSTADHVEGGSAWPGDPCGGEAGAATFAWTCPGSPGEAPPVQGCINTGGLQAIGGAGTGIPAQDVWCCPAIPDGDDAGETSDGGVGADDSSAGEGGGAQDGGSD